MKRWWGVRRRCRSDGDVRADVLPVLRGAYRVGDCPVPAALRRVQDVVRQAPARGAVQKEAAKCTESTRVVERAMLCESTKLQERAIV